MQPQYAPQPQPQYGQPAYQPNGNGYAPAPQAAPPTAANGTAQAFNGMAVPQMVNGMHLGDRIPSPNMRNLDGMVVGMTPVAFHEGKYESDKPGDPKKDAVTYTLHLFQPGVVNFGDNATDPSKSKPHSVTGPGYLRDCEVTNVAVVNKLKTMIDPMHPQVLVGRVGRGTAKNGQSAPWLVQALAPDDPAYHVISAYWDAYSKGQVPELKAEPSAGPPAVQAAQGWPAGAVPAAQFQQPAAPPPQGGQYQAGYAPQAGPVGPPPQGAQVNYAAHQMAGQQPPPQVAPQGPPAGGAPDLSQVPPPPGFEAVWAQMPNEARAKVLGL